jgi:hypothetical protein
MFELKEHISSMLASKHLYTLLADAVLVIHLGFAAFIVLGFVLIWIGFFLKWSFIRNFYFRLAHLTAMGIVMVETLIGLLCPMTSWEVRLRLLAGGGGYEGSFMQHWLHRILYIEISMEAFRVIYPVFFLFIALTFIVVKPRRTKVGLKKDRHYPTIEEVVK